MPIDLRLNDASQISQYMDSVAGNEEFSREAAEEFFQGAAATLTRFRVDSLQEGDAATNMRDEVKEQQYIDRDAQTSPPIMVEAGQVVDGGHRLRAARARKDVYIMGYDVHAMDEYPEPYSGPLNTKQGLSVDEQARTLGERKELAVQAQLYLESLKIKGPRPE